MSDKKDITDCRDHKNDVAGISDMKELANLISNLHYQTLAEFFGNLEAKLWFDSRKDKSEGREKLSTALVGAVDGINIARKNIESAWEISKHFME